MRSRTKICFGSGGSPGVTGWSPAAPASPWACRPISAFEARRTAFFAGVEGPAIVLVGQLFGGHLGAGRPPIARRTRRLQLEAEQALSPEQTLAQVAAFLDRHRNAGPLVFLQREPRSRARRASAVSAASGSPRPTTDFRRNRRRCRPRRLHALVAAGGETSGAVAEALGGNALESGPRSPPAFRRWRPEASSGSAWR